MKKIIFVRHAKAEDGSFMTSDFVRNLAPRGIQDAKKQAEILRNHEPKIDLFISSDANRAIQTASIFTKSYGINTENIQKEHFIYNDYDAEDLIDFLASLSDNYQTIALFGHNPNIAYAVAKLSNKHISSFSTCAMAIVEFMADSWGKLPQATGELKHLISPIH